MTDVGPGENRQLPGWATVHLWQVQIVRDAVVISCVVGIVYLGSALKTITVPLLIALGLAHLFEPMIVRAMSWNRRVTRVRLVLVTVFAVVVSLVTIALITIPTVIEQASQLVRNAPRYLVKIEESSRASYVPDFVAEQLATVRSVFVGDEQPPEPPSPEISLALDESRVRAIVAEEISRQSANDGDALSNLAKGGKTVLSLARRIVGDLVHVLLFVFLLCFFFATFSLSYPSVRSYLATFAAPTRRDRFRAVLERMDGAVTGFVLGRLLICVIVGLVYAVGWTACSVPYAFLLGFLTGALTIIPFLCLLALPVVWALLAIHLAGVDHGWYVTMHADGSIHVTWWRLLLFPSLVMVLAQLLDDYVLSPLIQSKATNMNPALVVVAAIAGGILGGIYGMLLAIPTMACVKILLTDVLLPSLRAWVRGERADPLPIDH
jgi:predicted PurR-regulated permease PerM